jgi:hypothetical protein
MSVPVDLAFVFDATGSMAPTIQAVRAKIVEIAVSLRTQYPTGYSFQFGAIGYRDKIDDGSTSVSCPFSPDPETMRRWLTTVQATGGGDICEDWIDAMDSVFRLNWRENSLRCIFWLADAPGHGAGLIVELANAEEFDAHPAQLLRLIPYIEKLAKMKMVVIGLDLNIAEISFVLMRYVYVKAGGPSFTSEKFQPEAGNEMTSIAALLEAKVMTLVLAVSAVAL